MQSSYSIVEFTPENIGHFCGYCKSSKTNYSNGMWAHTMSVDDYQALIDLGWRRSGQYCYKPTMKLTCCPLYTIKCEALNIKLTKSQKKVLKKMNRFLLEGERNTMKCDKNNEDNLNNETYSGSVNDVANLEDKALRGERKKDIAQVKSFDSEVNHGNYFERSEETKQTTKKFEGRDLSKPQCKKAKLIRLERKQKKLGEEGSSLEGETKKQPVEKTLEEFLVAPEGAEKLQVRLVSSNSSESQLRSVVWPLYVRYQTVVHKETEDDASYTSFYTFLVSTPLQHRKDKNGITYGSFHQQYWLNNKLIAVGVIDILPKCVSSVYFFYDPDYAHLTLGTYASLREVGFVRELAKSDAELCYYYLGYYLHSCPKMKYKGRLQPSLLLCPETYRWVYLDKCIAKLDASKYSKLDAASPSQTQPHLDKVLVLWEHVAMPYSRYKQRKPSVNDAKEVTDYARLVGYECAYRMLLLRD